MPIETDSDAWRNGEIPEDDKDEVLGFLQANSGAAYTLHEICDELTETSFAQFDEEERLRQELGQEEFYEQVDKEDRLDPADKSADNSIALYYQTIMNRLKDEGEVRSRNVDPDELDLPYDWEHTTVYAAAQD